MKAIISFAMIVVSAYAVAQQTVSVTTNSIQVRNTWKNTNSFSAEKIRKTLVGKMATSALTGTLTEVTKSAEKVNTTSLGTVLSEQKFYYYFQSKRRNFPKILFTLSQSTKDCAKSSDNLCYSQVDFSISGPYEFYKENHDFNLHQFAANFVQINFQVRKVKESWNSFHEFRIKNLMFLSWLDKAKKSFSLEDTPTAHHAILFSGELLKSIDRTLAKSL